MNELVINAMDAVPEEYRDDTKGIIRLAQDGKIDQVQEQLRNKDRELRAQFDGAFSAVNRLVQQ
jgi:predicted Zn-dependent protease with MMP-like domain